MPRIRKSTKLDSTHSSGQLRAAERSQFVGPRCPSCLSSNIQKRNVSIAAGRNTAVGLGVTSSGEIAMGIGHYSSELARHAEFESEDIGFAGTIISLFVGLFFGGIGWAVGFVFDGIFQTELLVYFTLIPLGVGCIGAFILLFAAQISSAKHDRAKSWICLACGAKFAVAKKIYSRLQTH